MPSKRETQALELLREYHECAEEPFRADAQGGFYCPFGCGGAGPIREFDHDTDCLGDLWNKAQRLLHTVSA